MNRHGLKHLLSLLVLLLIVVGLSAQYDQKEILTQQAYQKMAMRQFTEAENLFLQVLETNPEDLNSILQLLNIYFQTSQLDKAENFLKVHKRIIPPITALEQEILLLVMQGKPDAAWTLGETYLQRQNYSDNSYRIVASYFERRGFYEQMMRLYGEARTKLNNPDLFRLESANTALNMRQYPLALTEYLSFLDKNPGNIFFINSQCRTILNDDPEQITVIRTYALDSTNPVVKELYANALVYQKNYLEALEVFKNLPADRLIRFAEEQYVAANDQIALPTFRYLEEISTDTIAKNDYRLRQAMILHRNRDFAGTQTLLESIFADSLMLERKNLQRKGINLNARKLMAENALAFQRDPISAKTWLTEARKYCTNSYDLQDIDLSLVRLHLIREEYGEARAVLAGVNDPQLLELREYIRFTTELMSGNTGLADTLMNEYVIRYPSGKYVNDSIYQMMFALSLDASGKEAYFDAYRMLLLQDIGAVDSLRALYIVTNDEELLIQAVEWSLLMGDRTRATDILTHTWQDPICKEYAGLLSLLLTDDKTAGETMARDFLRESPNSIFAPRFRQSLNRINTSRPDY